MNTEEIIMLIENAFNDRIASSQSTYYLCIKDGHIVCNTFKKAEISDLVVQKINNSKINDGLTGREWNHLAEKIKLYCREYNLCLKDLKHSRR